MPLLGESSGGTPLAHSLCAMIVSGSLALPPSRAETSAKGSFEALNQAGQNDFSALLFLILSLPRSPEDSGESEPEEVGAQEFGAIQTAPNAELAIRPMITGFQLNGGESPNLDHEDRAVSSLAVGARSVLGTLNTLFDDGALENISAEEAPAARPMYGRAAVLNDTPVQSKNVFMNVGSQDAQNNPAEFSFGPDEKVAFLQFNGGARQNLELNSSDRVISSGTESTAKISTPPRDSLRNENSSNQNQVLKVAAVNESQDLMITSISEGFFNGSSQAKLMAKTDYTAQTQVARVGESLTSEENFPPSGEKIAVNSAFVPDRPVSRTATTLPENSIPARSFAPLNLGGKLALWPATDRSTGEDSAVEFVSPPHRFYRDTAVSSFGALRDQLLPAFDVSGDDGEWDLLSGGRKSAPPNATPSVFFSTSALQKADGISADIRSTANWYPVVEYVAGEIAAHIRFDKREAVIQLDPPELGKLKIDLQLDGDKLHAYVVAEGQDARNLIEHHVHELRQSLQAQQIDLVEIRIDQGDWANGRGDFTNGQRQQGANGEREWQGGSSAPPVEPNEKTKVRRKLPETGRVSMWA